jgi:hypothetical protein
MMKADDVVYNFDRKQRLSKRHSWACSLWRTMIYLQLDQFNSLEDARCSLQTAIGVEFGTLPPYLYALYSICPGTNREAVQRIKAVALQEMVHICLASNILNSLGGNPVLRPQTYPGALPGDIGPHGTPLTLHLYPFSCAAMKQAMEIEQPENPPPFPERFLDMERLLDITTPRRAVTVGTFYRALDVFLSTLPAGDWTAGRNQIVDNQFFASQLFAVNNYGDAHKAIEEIVSEGEGTAQSTGIDPLDFQDEVAHYFRFGEIYHDRVLTKANNCLGYTWGPDRLGVDWSAVYPAISDPGLHDFSVDPPEAQAAQDACDKSFSAMVNAIQRAFNGEDGALGEAVQEMLRLRMAALHAFTVRLADGLQVAGPAFRSAIGRAA